MSPTRPATCIALRNAQRRYVVTRPTSFLSRRVFSASGTRRSSIERSRPPWGKLTPMAKHVLIAGASGVVGFSALRHFSSASDCKITAISRRAPIERGRARFLSVDLADASACKALANELSDVTHLVYAALHE